jgi:TatA/E family protein of Tat protein translocase
MPNIGPVELIIILVIALLILGPGKLPDVGAAVGKSIKEFRKATQDVTDTVNSATATTPPASAAAPVAPAPVAAAPVVAAAVAPAPVAPAAAATPAPAAVESVAPPAPVPAETAAVATSAEPVAGQPQA